VRRSREGGREAYLDAVDTDVYHPQAFTASFELSSVCQRDWRLGQPHLRVLSLLHEHLAGVGSDPQPAVAIDRWGRAVRRSKETKGRPARA
jgi:hypothetical protein